MSPRPQTPYRRRWLCPQGCFVCAALWALACAPATANMGPPRVEGAAPALSADPAVKADPTIEEAVEAPVEAPVEKPVPEQEIMEVPLGAAARTASGVTIRFVARGHKHAVSGGAAGNWELELAAGDTTQTLDVRGSKLYVEHPFRDQLFIISEVDADRVRVEARTNPAAAASPDDAVSQLRERLAQLGVSFVDATVAHSEAHGVLSLSVMRGSDVVAVAEVGLHTGALLAFERPLAAAFRPRRGKPLQRFRLHPGRSKTLDDGSVVRWARQGHKHRVKGGAVGIWEFTVHNAGEKKSVALTAESLYAELGAFGHVFTFATDDEGRVVVRVYAQTRGRMSENRAMAKAEALGLKLGLDSDGSVISEHAGAYEFVLRKQDRDLIWGRVGVFTHRIADYALRDRPAGSSR